MNLKKTEFLLILILITNIGCVASKSVVVIQEDVYLEGFKNFTIDKDSVLSKDEKVAYEVLYNRLSAKGLSVISYNDIDKSTQEDLTRTLYINISSSMVSNGLLRKHAMVHIEMYNILNQLVYAGRGKFQKFTNSASIIGATKQALNGFEDRYNSYDASLNPVIIRVHK